MVKGADGSGLGSDESDEEYLAALIAFNIGSVFINMPGPPP
jgi:hypothetical protein